MSSKGLAFNLARVAHWLVNDKGFTREQASRELAQYARELDPSLDPRALGDAARFVDESQDGAA